MIRREGARKWFVRAVTKWGRKQRLVIGHKADAVKVYFELLTQIYEEHGIVKKTTLTFNMLIDVYVEQHLKFKRSHDNFRYTLDRLKEALGPVYINEFTRETFENYLMQLESCRTQTHDRYRPATVNKYLILAKCVFNHAVENQILKENPIGKIPLREVNNVRDKVLNQDEYAKLKDCLPDYLKPICDFAVQVPVRKMELVNMKVSDVDLVENIIYVPDGTTKSGKGRQLPIPPNMVSYFRDIPKDSEWAFYRKEYGKCLNLGDFKRAFRHACELANLTWLHFHDFRHCAITAMSRRGIPQTVIMRIAGLTTNSVFNRYRTVNINDVKNVFDYAN